MLISIERIVQIVRYAIPVCCDTRHGFHRGPDHIFTFPRTVKGLPLLSTWTLLPLGMIVERSSGLEASLRITQFLILLPLVNSQMNCSFTIPE